MEEFHDLILSRKFGLLFLFKILGFLWISWVLQVPWHTLCLASNVRCILIFLTGVPFYTESRSWLSPLTPGFGWTPILFSSSYLLNSSLLYLGLWRPLSELILTPGPKLFFRSVSDKERKRTWPGMTRFLFLFFNFSRTNMDGTPKELPFKLFDKEVEVSRNVKKFVLLLRKYKTSINFFEVIKIFLLTLYFKLTTCRNH